MNLLQKYKEYLSSADIKASEATVKNYRVDISHFIIWYQSKYKTDFNPVEITLEIINEFKKDKLQTLSQATLDRHISSLRNFFSFLTKNSLLAKNPFSDLKKQAQEIIDPLKVNLFKNYLYSSKNSHLTIKSYIIDLRQFVSWLKQVSISQNINFESNLNNYLNQEMLNQYRLMLVREANFSESSIKRKLSSIKKYLDWANSEGLVFAKELPIINQNKTDDEASLKNEVEIKEPFKYSSFPPFRLFQKILKLLSLITDLLIISSLAKIFFTAEMAYGKISGKQIFHKNAAKEQISNLAPHHHSLFGITKQQGSNFFESIKLKLSKWYKKYRSNSFAYYFQLSVLVILMSAIGFGIYDNFFSQARHSLATLPTAPPRKLSFQARLTDSNDNPITSRTNLRFAIYNDSAATGGAQLWEELQNVVPDVNGIFSTILGNNVAIPSTLFTQNASLYLGVTVEQTSELTPRQQLATVAYATNAETLQGLPPITAAGAGQTNVVLALDGSSNLTIGGSAAPTFQASGGLFTLIGQGLSLQTTSNSNITLFPNGFGLIDLQRPLENTTHNNNIGSAIGAVEADSLFAVLATSSGQSAFTLVQNSTGPILSASAGATPEFTIANNGNVNFAGNSSFMNTLTSAVSGAAKTWTFPNVTGTVCISGDSCASSGTVGYWQRTLSGGSNYLSPATNTDRLVIGATTGLASSDFRALSGTLAIASVSGQSSFAGLVVDNSGVGDIFTASSSGLPRMVVTQNGNVGIGTTTPGTRLEVFSPSGTTPLKITQNATHSSTPNLINFADSGGQTGFIAIYSSTGELNLNGTNGLVLTGGNQALGAYINTSGSIGVNTTSPNALLDLRGTNGANNISGTIPVATVSGKTSFATMVVDNSGVGDIFTASSSGLPRFTVTQNGAIELGTSQGANGNCLLSGGTGVAASWGSCAAGTNFWQRNTSGSFTYISPLTNTDLLSIGGTAGNATADIKALSGTLPVASISGSTSLASLIVDNKGTGDIFTASSSGLNRFVITQNGSVGIGTTMPSTDISNCPSPSCGGLDIYPRNNNGAVLALNSTGGAGSVIMMGETNTLGGEIGYNQTLSDGFEFRLGGSLLSANDKMVISNAGLVGINVDVSSSKLPLGVLDVRGTNGLSALSGTIPVASISGQTSFAGLVVDNKGAGDIFTASSSGLNRFVVTQNGNVGVGTTTPTTALNVVGNSGLALLRLDATNSTPDDIIFSRTDVSNSRIQFWDDNSGNLQICDNNDNHCLGFIQGGNVKIGSPGTNNISAAATFDVQPVSGTIAVASISGKTSFASLVVDNSGAGDLFTASSSGLNRFVITQNGNVGVGTTLPTAKIHIAIPSGNTAGLQIDAGSAAPWALTFNRTDVANSQVNLFDDSGSLEIRNNGGGVTSAFTYSQNAQLSLGTTSPLATLDIRASTIGGNGGTVPIASFSGKTSFAGLVVDNSGVGDLFTASNSSIPVFTIKQNGNLVFGNGNPGTLAWAGLTAAQTITLPNSTGTICISGQTCASSGTVGYWQRNASGGSNYLSPATNTDMLAIGGTTGNATADIKALSGTLPVASISGKTSLAAEIVDNSGVGDIWTASSSGLTRMVVTQSGNVGIGTAKPQSRLDLTMPSASGYPLDLHRSDQASSYINFSDEAGTLRIDNNGGTVHNLQLDQNGNLTINQTALIGANNNNPTAAGGTLDVRSVNGTQPTASISGQTSFAGLVVDNSGLGDLITASSSGLSRFTITQNGTMNLNPNNPNANLGNVINVASPNHTYMTLTNQDLTVGGHKANTTISQVQKVFVYDTSKDSDGGKWTNDERAQASSWYNESLNTATRGSTKPFPRKAILIVSETSAALSIYDAKDNSLWMQFNKGSGGTAQMVGPTTGSTASSVFALNGKIYLANSGNPGGLYVIDFKQDTGYRYNTSGLNQEVLSGSSSVANISNRNSTITFSTITSIAGKFLTNSSVSDVYANIINGNTYVTAASDTTSNGSGGDVSLFNESTESVVADFGPNNIPVANVWLTSTGTLYATMANSTTPTNYALKIKYNAQNASGIGQLFDEVYASIDSTHYGGTTTDNNTFASIFSTTNQGPASSSATMIATTSGMFVTQATSTVDGKSDTVYLAATDNTGGKAGSLMAFQLKKGDPNNASVKYYTANNITDDMVGDTRAMYPLDSNVGSGLANTAVAGSYYPDTYLKNGVTAPTYTAHGVRGQAGTIAKLSYAISSSSALLKAVTNPMSVTAWVHPTSADITNNVESLWVSADKSGTTAQVSWGIGLLGNGSNAVINCFANGSSAVSLPSIINIANNSWYHVALTSDASGNLKCYVNGQLTATGTVSSAEVPTAFQIGHTEAGATNTNFNGVAGDIGGVMVTANTLTSAEIAHMYQVGFRALQNHPSSPPAIRGVTPGQDARQQLNSSPSTTDSNVNAVAASLQNGQIYIGTRGGGISVIGMDTDTLTDLYSSSINTTDDTGTTWPTNNDQIQTISVGQSYGNGMLLAFGGNNVNNGGVWMETNDTTLKDFMATNYNPFGGTLTQSNLNVDTILRVSNQLSTRLDNDAFGATSSAALADAFRVDNNGNLLSRSLVNSTTAMQFQDSLSNTILNIDSTNDRLGVGITSPASILDVRGNTQTNAGTIPVASISGKTSVAALVVDNKGAGDLFTASSSGLNRFVITQNGNVGIGTTNPQETLHIVNTISQFTLGLDSGSNGYPETRYMSNGTTEQQFADVTTNGGYFSTTQVNDFVSYSTGGGNWLWGKSGSEVFRINNSGTIGINTNSPNAILDIRGTNGNETLSGTVPVASISGKTSLPSLVVDNSSGVGDIFTASTAGATRFSISNVGNIALTDSTRIGFVTPANSAGAIVGLTNYSLYGSVIGSQTVLNGPGSSGIISFDSSNNELMRLTASGTLGLNATAPKGILDIRGNGVGGINAISGTIPVASMSGVTSSASLVTNNDGVGDLFTASSSGATRFRLTGSNALFQEDIIASIGNGAQNNGSNAVSNVIGDQGSLVPNAGFESHAASSGAMFADGWFGAATSSGATVWDNSVQAKGLASAKVTLPTSKTAFYSSCIPVAIQTGAGGTNSLGTYTLNYYTKATGGSATIPTVRAYLEGYANKANCQTDTSGTDSGPASTAAVNNLAWGTLGSGITALTGWGNSKTFTWARVHFFIGSSASPPSTVNIDGVRLTEADEGQGLDYAENYPADPNNIPQPGDVVSISSQNGVALVSPTDKSMDPDTIGIVSTKPGYILDDGNVPDPKVPIALSGRVPVRVSTKNGPIHIGDYLTSSDISGVAVKGESQGYYIGTAMTDYDGPADKIGTVTIFVKLGYNNPVYIADTGSLNIASQLNPDGSTSYSLKDQAGIIITNIGAYSKAMIANLEAGAVKAQEISTKSIAIATNNISIAGKSLDDYITDKVNQILQANYSNPSGLISPIASVNEVHTNVISPLSSESITLKSKVVILSDSEGSQGQDSSPSAQNDKVLLDVHGGASISGQLTSNTIQTNDATISGTLHAGRIYADQIIGLPSSSPSATYITNIYQATPSANQSNNNSPLLLGEGQGEVASTSSQPKTNQVTNSNQIASSQAPRNDNTTYQLPTTYSGYLSYVPNLDTATVNALQSNPNSQNQTILSDTTVIGTLSVDNLILADNSINVLGKDLQLQPLKQGGVSIADGSVYIDSNGNLTVNGDATFRGKLAANIISPLANQDLTLQLPSCDRGSSSCHSRESGNPWIPDQVQDDTGSNLVVKNASNSGVFSINQLGDIIASGAATISKLNLQIASPALAVSDTEIVATGSAGTTAINPYQREITIDNANVTDKSLIYITPIGKPTGESPFLLRQDPNKSFTVGISDTTPDATQFNWLIIN